MFTTHQTNPNLIEARVGGKITSIEMGTGIDALAAMARDMEDGSILMIYDDFDMPEAGAIVEELKRLPQLFEMISHVSKIAILSDQAWVRKAAEFEGMIIPGVTIRGYPIAERAQAEAFLSGEQLVDDDNDFGDNMPV